MRINLSENKIRKIVSETLNRFILKETFTNMKQLYHKTTIDTLLNIIRTNSFYLLKSNHDCRGGKYYASLSRHKNTKEGFDAVFYSEERETNIMSYAVITFNIPKLTRVHGISIKPFDFYGIYPDETNANDRLSSKSIYQKLLKNPDLWDEKGMYNPSLYSNYSIEDGDDDFYDGPEYYNMAEENIVSDTVKEIPEIFNYIDNIDIHFPNIIANSYEDPITGEIYDEDYGEIETCQYAHALCQFINGTPWENKITISLTDGFDKIKKVMSIREFHEWLKKKDSSERHAKGAKWYLNKKPVAWDKCGEYGMEYDD